MSNMNSSNSLNSLNCSNNVSKYSLLLSLYMQIMLVNTHITSMEYVNISKFLLTLIELFVLFKLLAYASNTSQILAMTRIGSNNAGQIIGLCE